MPQKISDEVKAVIKRQLEEDRLGYQEIADLNKVGLAVVWRVAQKAGINRKDRRGKKKQFIPKILSQKKSEPAAPIKTENFDQMSRLELIDRALTIHKSHLCSITNPYEMDRWTSALDRLLSQRREEAPPDPPKTDSDGFFEMLSAKGKELFKSAALDDYKEQIVALLAEEEKVKLEAEVKEDDQDE